MPIVRGDARAFSTTSSGVPQSWASANASQVGLRVVGRARSGRSRSGGRRVAYSHAELARPPGVAVAVAEDEQYAVGGGSRPCAAAKRSRWRRDLLGHLVPRAQPDPQQAEAGRRRRGRATAASPRPCRRGPRKSAARRRAARRVAARPRARARRSRALGARASRFVVEPLPALVEIHAERAELARRLALPEAESSRPPDEVVEHHDLLDDAQRVVPGQDDDHRAERQRAGSGRRRTTSTCSGAGARL